MSLVQCEETKYSSLEMENSKRKEDDLDDDLNARSANNKRARPDQSLDVSQEEDRVAEKTDTQMIEQAERALSDMVGAKLNRQTTNAAAIRPARYPYFSNESYRIQSYSKWPHKIPSREDCAKAGFFYTGQMDLIRCFQCGIGLKDISPEDDPLIEHFQHAKECLYLVAMFGEGGPNLKPPSSESYNSDALSELKSSQFRTFEARMKSFESSNFRCLKQPKQLAEAGLYFTGVGDVVRCFSCDGGLRNWEEHDDPWTEHCMWFPSCRFAREIKGDAFIERVQRRKKICGNATQLTDKSDQNDLDFLDNLDKLKDCEKDMCQIDREPKETIYEQNKRLRDIVKCCQCKDKDINALILQCGHHKLCMQCARGLQSCPFCKQHIEEIRETFRTVTPAFMKKENQSLKKQIYCSRCKTRESNALFLPCTHHLLCMLCGAEQKICPFCDQKIDNIIRTYRS
ncbi:hypothetical protein DPMN_055335 [Dreissena polymorpha]|uniref:RING-type domain-containing protein n=1 Tax=Dreissena polymorpha TaxID=45954 RepID=A0A9D4CRM3_DREPO|nr:hypothetical protein DPMN_055335 [Dreissena polymorpha]